MRIDDLPNQYQYCEECGNLISDDKLRFFCDICLGKEID